MNQAFALLIFYVLSRQLDKEQFGEFNWSLAVLLTAFVILSFGMEQTIVRKIASGEDSSKLTSLYCYHTLFFGFLFFGTLILFSKSGSFLQPLHVIISVLCFGKWMLFLSSPFKQLANGRQKFGVLSIMNLVSSLIKGLGIILLILTQSFTLLHVVILFAVSELSECIVNIAFAITTLEFHLHKFRWKEYIQLLKTSSSQAGVVLLSSALARFDWIFIGLFLPLQKLAEYSFAYKVFEMAALPLLVIAPMLLPAFAADKNNLVINHRKVNTLMKMEVMIASIIALLLIMLWVPVVNFITGGKYGESNHFVIAILCVSMPTLYVNNLLWSWLFANGKAKAIFKIFLLTFLLNVATDIVLIPLMQNEGAAVGYIAALFLQTFLYAVQVKKMKMLSLSYRGLLIATAVLAISFSLSFLVPSASMAILVTGILFMLILFIKPKRMNDFALLAFNSR